MYHYCNTVFRGCIYVVIRHIGQKTGLKDNLPENYNDYPQNYPYEDESSNCHGQYIPPTASRQAPPVHEATGGHAVRGNYCIHYHVWGNFADNQKNYRLKSKSSYVY